MFKRRTSTLVFALALACALLAPHAALGGRLSDPTPAPAASNAAPNANVSEVDDAADAASDTEAAADDAKPAKPKGNAFARALAAPFRALARLFGGGRKNETAKKPAAHAAQETAAAAPLQPAPQNAVTEVTTAQEEPRSAPAAVNADSPRSAPAQAQAQAIQTQAPPSETPKVVPVAATVAPTVESARASEGVRIVQPSEREVAQELRPKMWIPLIVGVPSDPVSQGRALLQHGYIQEAIAELQIAATNVGPQLGEANNLLGLAYDRLGWHTQAAEAYGRALTVSPKDYIALTNLGYSLYLADDFAGALRRLNEAAKLAPTEPVIFNNLGVVNARLGRYGDAYRNFVKASNDYEAHLKLAGILEDQRNDKDAIKHYEAALKLQPGASAVLERLVALYERTGARDKADTARRALSQPRNPQKTATGGGG